MLRPQNCFLKKSRTKELIVNRANAEKEHMGLTTWENAPDGKIVKTDVGIAKNYLKGVELEDMGRLVNAVLLSERRRTGRYGTFGQCRVGYG